METQLDHNAYSALFSDSEESESSELSALLANPDIGTEKPLSIRELQEPSEAGLFARVRKNQKQDRSHGSETLPSQGRRGRQGRQGKG